MTFGAHKMLGISWVTEQQLASQEGLSPMELFPHVSVIYVCDALSFEVNYTSS
jgi:hypothetical protein